MTQTWGMFSTRRAPDFWRPYFDLADETAAAGGRIFVQVHSRALNTMLSFETQMPFDHWDVWRDIRGLPLAEQHAKLRDPALRAKLVEVANGPRPERKIVGVEARPPDWDWFFVLDSMLGQPRRLADLARERDMDPVDLMIELALQKDLKQFFCQPAANEDQDHVLEMMRHPRSVVTFSDSGAHVSQIMDSSLQTHLLGHWVREREAMTLEEAVRQLTSIPASSWGMHDRGLLREGLNADLVVFDPDTIGPRMPEVVHDLPGGATRLKQVADGHQPHDRGRRGVPGGQRAHGSAGRETVPGDVRFGGCEVPGDVSDWPRSGTCSRPSPCGGGRRRVSFWLENQVRTPVHPGLE